MEASSSSTDGFSEKVLQPKQQLKPPPRHYLGEPIASYSESSVEFNRAKLLYDICHVILTTQKNNKNINDDILYEELLRGFPDRVIKVQATTETAQPAKKYLGSPKQYYGVAHVNVTRENLFRDIVTAVLGRSNAGEKITVAQIYEVLQSGLPTNAMDIAASE